MLIVMLIVDRTIDYIVMSGIVSFVILGYSLPRRNSRLVSGILFVLFINGTVGAFLSLSFAFPPVNWIILMMDLLFAMLRLLMLVGTWFAFRCLQATFFYHRIKHSEIIWKNIICVPIISIGGTFLFGVALFRIVQLFWGSEISNTIIPILAKCSIAISCVVTYFLVKKFPTVHYTKIEESAYERMGT